MISIVNILVWLISGGIWWKIVKSIIESNPLKIIPAYLSYVLDGTRRADQWDVVMSIIESNRLRDISTWNFECALAIAHSKGQWDVVMSIIESDRFKDIQDNSLRCAFEDAVRRRPIENSYANSL